MDNIEANDNIHNKINKWVLDYAMYYSWESYKNDDKLLQRDLIQGVLHLPVVETQKTELQTLLLISLCKLVDGDDHLTRYEEDSVTTLLEDLIEQTAIISSKYSDFLVQTEQFISAIKTQAVYTCCRAGDFDAARYVLNRLQADTPTWEAERLLSILESVVASEDINHPELTLHPYSELKQTAITTLGNLISAMEVPFLLRTARNMEEKYAQTQTQDDHKNTNSSNNKRTHGQTPSPVTTGIVMDLGTLNDLMKQLDSGFHPHRDKPYLSEQQEAAFKNKLRRIRKSREYLLGKMPENLRIYGTCDDDEDDDGLTQNGSEITSTNKLPPSKEELPSANQIPCINEEGPSANKVPRISDHDLDLSDIDDGETSHYFLSTKRKNNSPIKQNTSHKSSKPSTSPDRQPTLSQKSSRELNNSRSVFDKSYSKGKHRPKKKQSSESKTSGSGSGDDGVKSSPDQKKANRTSTPRKKNGENMNRAESRDSSPETDVRQFCLKRSVNRQDLYQDVASDSGSDHTANLRERLHAGSMKNHKPRESLAPTDSDDSLFNATTKNSNKRKKWSENEEELLYKAVQRRGLGRWADIVQSGVLPNRSNMQIKDKWRNLTGPSGRNRFKELYHRYGRI